MDVSEFFSLLIVLLYSSKVKKNAPRNPPLPTVSLREFPWICCCCCFNRLEGYSILKTHLSCTGSSHNDVYWFWRHLKKCLWLLQCLMCNHLTNKFLANRLKIASNTEILKKNICIFKKIWFGCRHYFCSLFQLLSSTALFVSTNSSLHK